MTITFERTTKKGDDKKRPDLPREKRNFSKVILGAVMVLYFLGAFFGGYVVLTTGYGLEALLGYIGAPTATAIGFYAWKAKNENCKKIGGNFAENYGSVMSESPETSGTTGTSIADEDLKG